MRARAGVVVLIAAALVVTSAARAELVRGTIKVDVRDAAGATREADVTVEPEAGGDVRKVARTGEVYVADGLLDGNWIVRVQGAPPVTVRVRGRRVTGAVVILGAPPARGKRAAAAGASFTVGPTETACDDEAGVVIEAIAFCRGALGAGRVDVKNERGKTLCAASIAGGGASLRLKPGRYVVDARFVGGKSARTHYELREGRTPPPLVLRAN
jgi:hypothetical protein